jgi:hypothetical protein
LGTIFISGCGRQIDLLKIVGKNIAYESRHPLLPPASKLRAFPRDNPGIHVGWVGHSTVLLSFYGTLILTDPNFSRRIVIARRVVDLPIKPDEIKELDFILVSHPHYDHLNVPSLKRLPKESSVIVPPGCKDLIDGLGFSKVVERNKNKRPRFWLNNICVVRIDFWLNFYCFYLSAISAVKGVGDDPRRAGRMVL